MNPDIFVEVFSRFKSARPRGHKWNEETKQVVREVLA